MAQLPSAGTTNGLCVQVAAWNPTDYNFPHIQASGVKFVRSGLDWSTVESHSPGLYDFDWSDEFAASAAATGTRILWDLDYGNPTFYGSDYTSAAWRQAFTNDLEVC